VPSAALALRSYSLRCDLLSERHGEKTRETSDLGNGSRGVCCLRAAEFGALDYGH